MSNVQSGNVPLASVIDGFRLIVALVPGVMRGGQGTGQRIRAALRRRGAGQADVRDRGAELRRGSGTLLSGGQSDRALAAALTNAILFGHAALGRGLGGLGLLLRFGAIEADGQPQATRAFDIGRRGWSGRRRSERQRHLDLRRRERANVIRRFRLRRRRRPEEPEVVVPARDPEQDQQRRHARGRDQDQLLAWSDGAFALDEALALFLGERGFLLLFEHQLTLPVRGWPAAPCRSRSLWAPTGSARVGE